MGALGYGPPIGGVVLVDLPPNDGAQAAQGTVDLGEAAFAAVGGTELDVHLLARRAQLQDHALDLVTARSLRRALAGARAAGDGSGGAYIVWEDNRNGTGHEDIYAQRLDVAGVAVPGFVQDRIQAEVDAQFSLAQDLPLIVDELVLEEGRAIVRGTIR